MSRPATRETGIGTLALRGAAAAVVALLVGGLLIARGAGALDPGVTVHTSVPSEAGRVPQYAPVFYLGVRVGDVRRVDGEDVTVGSGTAEPGSEVEMLIDREQADHIPQRSVVRVVPRTLFGDIRIEIVPPETVDGAAGPRMLARDSRLDPDRSAEAVELYDVFTRANDLIAAAEPQHLQVMLTELARALDGRGAALGRTIDRTDDAGAQLMGSLEDSFAASPALAHVVGDLERATPDLLATLESATELSRIVLDRPGALGRLLDAGLQAGAAGTETYRRSGPEIITAVGDAAEITGDIAADPHGVLRTLEGLEPMAGAGAQVYSTGRFNITAVPSFQDPVPYGPQDCPEYRGVPGATCGGGADAAAWSMFAPMAREAMEGQR